jgi:hypothetical protein
MAPRSFIDSNSLALDSRNEIQIPHQVERQQIHLERSRNLFFQSVVHLVYVILRPGRIHNGKINVGDGRRITARTGTVQHDLRRRAARSDDGQYAVDYNICKRRHDLMIVAAAPIVKRGASPRARASLSLSSALQHFLFCAGTIERQRRKK